MKLILCLFLLPALCVARVQNIVCPDGKECPLGETCCESSSGVFQCCDLPEDERQNQKLIPALISHSIPNVSYSSSDGAQFDSAYCPTSCGPFCCPFYSGVCCQNQLFCCDSGLRCCQGTSISTPWCCRKRDRCSSTYGYCKAGASSVSVAILSLAFTFVFATMSKYFL